MLKMANQNAILYQLLPNHVYHGILVLMPTGKHIFQGLLGAPIGKGKHVKFPPLFTHNNDDKIVEMIMDIEESSILKPEDGIFAEEVRGTKDKIWAAKIRLDKERHVSRA